MRVLLVGTLPRAIDGAEEVLQSGGHEVVRCREKHGGAFPCTALTERGSCPLEAAPVDVVVTARAQPWRRPSRTEDGAVCGIHRFVPLVVHGATAFDPFQRWAFAETATDDELLAAVARAAHTPLPEHGAVATSVVRNLLATHGVADDPSDVEVRRSDGRLTATLHLTAAAEPHAAAITVKILTALRDLDPYVDGIDVMRA